MSDVSDVPDRAILLIDSARMALAEAKSVPELKEGRDKLAAIQHYLRGKEGSEEAALDAAELKLRYERRLGELLAEPGERRGGNFHGGSSVPLPDGITHKQSHRWRRVAAVAERDFEREIARARERSDPPTTQAMVKMAVKKEKAAVNGAAAVDSCTVGDLETLITRGLVFGTIYADPPWQYDNQGTRAATGNHYQTMAVEQIAALPIAKLAAEKCHLHLWTTDSFLEDAIAILLEWGFERRQTFVWVKPQLGIGNYWRSSHEYMLLGVKGGLTFPPSDVKSWIKHDRTRHSAKPEVVRNLIERMSPGPRLELFGRQVVDRWVVWGNQIERGMFDADIKEMTA